jgi:sugar (pentulose or hexulose) kinase
MKKEVILIFDVGKTNKKFLLFDRDLKVIHMDESRFDEVQDEDGFPCDDADRMESWVIGTLQKVLASENYLVKGVNFTSYGASVVYLDERGERMTPLYNYLKPLPDHVLEGFYESYGGEEEFSRNTASPALGMLNAGLQILWIKRTRPELFGRVDQVLHLPQYLSYLVTRRIASEHTSIGCHTALWDFDAMQYHPWLDQEDILLPDPLPVTETVPVQMGEMAFHAGFGIHDSSASLVPYIQAAQEPFILISTGTWCISMNPFNHEPLTCEELTRDCLCYLSAEGHPVKSSRFFLGHIHDGIVERLESLYQVEQGAYKGIRPGPGELRNLWAEGLEKGFFFQEDAPEDGEVRETGMAQFRTFREAYTWLMLDLTKRAIKSVQLIIPRHDISKHLYITGGFARNPFFTGFMAIAFPSKTVFTSEMDHATSLGAALVISPKVWPDLLPVTDLGLKRIDCSHLKKQV